MKNKKTNTLLQRNISRTAAIIILPFITITGLTYAANNITGFSSAVNSGDIMTPTWYNSVNDILKNINPSGDDLNVIWKISSSEIPTADNHLVNKKYFDDNISSGPTWPAGADWADWATWPAGADWTDWSDGIDGNDGFTNLLDISSWTISNWSIGSFTMNGVATENYRVWWDTPYESRWIVWEARPDAASWADGWWNHPGIPIDHTKWYRSSVWIKKTWSANWTTYLGASWAGTNNLSWTANTNPYFWAGDLPLLDRWYLLVGYIHASWDTSITSKWGIYDWETGEKVASMTDYKNAVWSTSQNQRTYLFYDTVTTDRQYFWGPRFEEINGNEPTVEQMLWEATNKNYNDTRFINVWESGDSIGDNTIDSSEIQDNTLTTSDILNNTLTYNDLAQDSVRVSELAPNSVDSSNVIIDSLTAVDLAPNSVWNSELIANPTFTNPIVSTPTAWTHVTNKAYVDNLINGLSWKAPSATSASATHWTCTAAKEAWTTFNKADNIIYVCNGSAWVQMSSTVWLPNLAWEVTGSITSNVVADNTIDSANVTNNTLTTSDILNNTLTEDDISNSFIARNSNLLDNINSTSFLRSDTNDVLTAAIVVPTANRDEWIFGTYDSTKTQHIWSMWTSYRNNAAGTNFGNLYGLAYKHTNNTTWWTMAWSHQMVWNQNGSPKAALWTNIWTSGSYIVDSTQVISNDAWLEWDRIRQNTIDDSEIADNILTAASLAPNSVWNSELIDTPLVTRLYLGATDTSLYRDAANRIATDDSFYVQPASPATYLYSTNTYLWSTSGDSTHLRWNRLTWNTWTLTAAWNMSLGSTTAPTQRLQVTWNIQTTWSVKTTCIWNCF